MSLNLSKDELYEIKACVNMAHVNLCNGEYKAYLQEIENKINILLSGGKND